jgi:hypothetical protein
VIAHRIWWGVRWGLVFGVAFCALALVAFLVGGRATFEALGTSLSRVLAVYLAAGVVLGVLVGVFRPLAARPVGAGALGFAGGLLFGALIRVSQDGLYGWGARDAFRLIMFAAILGAPVGVIYREIFTARPKRKAKR